MIQEVSDPEKTYYVGLDVHKRTICYCVKDSRGAIHSEGSLSATRLDLDRWMKTLPQPWSAAMEATMFTGWIYRGELILFNSLSPGLIFALIRPGSAPACLLPTQF